MKSKRLKFVFVFFVIFFLALPLLSGCAASKTKYESSVKAVLADLEESLEKNNADDQIRALEQAKSRFEGIEPPDDFFMGHSDLIEFLELTAETLRKIETSKDAKNKTPATDRSRTEIQQLIRDSGNAYAKSLRGLPFLEYELNKTFGGLIDQIQNQAFERPPPNLQRPSDR